MVGGTRIRNASVTTPNMAGISDFAEGEPAFSTSGATPNEGRVRVFMGHAPGGPTVSPQTTIEGNCSTCKLAALAAGKPPTSTTTWPWANPDTSRARRTPMRGASLCITRPGDVAPLASENKVDVAAPQSSACRRRRETLDGLNFGGAVKLGHEFEHDRTSSRRRRERRLPSYARGERQVAGRARLRVRPSRGGATQGVVGRTPRHRHLRRGSRPPRWRPALITAVAQSC
jgi:hypothetical protein